MKKFSLIVLVAILTVNLAQTQEYYKTYDWEKPQYVKPAGDESKTLLNKKVIIEYDFSGENYMEYNLIHTIEYINSNDEVEMNNKKYIPLNNSTEIVEAKARVIKENNETTEMSSSDILEAFDEETGRNYKYFALEGLEVGNIVEFIYILKRFPRIYGNYWYLQEENPIEKLSFELLCPDYLGFAFDVKHDTNKIITDTLVEGYNRYILNIEPVKRLKKEDSSPYNALRKRITYRLDKNFSNGSSGLVSYEQASQNIYNSMYNKLDKTELKALQKFAKGMKLDEQLSGSDKIRAIEDYVKGNINIIENDDNRFDNLQFSIMNKTSNSYGITKLFVNLYKQFGIEHQLVSTTDRTEIPFDKDFESFHNLSEYLIYFPATETFVCPDIFEYRTPLIPAEYTDNYGLFIKEVAIGEFKSGLGEIDYIPMLPYKTSHHNIDLTAVINEEFTNVGLTISQSSSGYYANFLQAILELVGEDIYNDIGSELITGIMENLEADTWELINVGAGKVAKEPLLLVLEGSNSQLIDVAGDNYLFKVGELIGPQVEMYSESERELPVHDNYKREFVRKLEVIIPEGYEVQNPEELEVYADYTRDNQKILLFESTYTIEGQKITILINEYYDQVSYELSEYNNYRKVVNSASDFNKITLVIAKKQ